MRRGRDYGAYLKNPNPKKPRTTAWRHDRNGSGSTSSDDSMENEINPVEAQQDDELNAQQNSPNPEHAPAANLPGLNDDNPNNVNRDVQQFPTLEEEAEEERNQDDAMGINMNEEPELPNPPGQPPPAQEQQAPFRNRREHLNMPLFEGLQTTKFECLFMCLHFYLRHGLTSVALKDLLKLINCLFNEEVISEGLDHFQNLFKGSLEIEHHVYCADCLSYIGNRASYSVDVVSVPCPVCEKACPVQKGTNSFAYIPIAQQLRNIFENTPNISELLQYRFNQQVSPDEITDIYDASVYKKLCEDGNFLSNPFNVSLTFATDGAPVWSSVSNSCWPLQFFINEIPPTHRFDRWHCLVAGVYFSRQDPEMSCFLTPFVRECFQLYHNGFQWKNPSNGEIITSKVLALNCVLDSVGKPKLQGMRQFNGYFGCNYCYHPGVKIPAHRHPRYIIDDDVIVSPDLECTYEATRHIVVEGEEISETFNVTDRTNESLRNEMEEVLLTHQEHEKGAKTKSILCAFPFFDIVFGFGLDYLHAVLIGVLKLVLSLSFDSKNHEEPYYLKPRMGDIDKRLKHIKPPSSISRRPRTLEDLANWHANEYRAFLLYYSIPCFAGIMKTEYLKHHCLLVTAIFILLQNKISKEDLRKSAQYLSLYVRDFARLYGAQNMHFNVHLILHLPKFVSMYGPLWCFSAFCFESGNGFLVKLVKGTVSVVSQIARKYAMSMCAPEMCRRFNVDQKCIQFCTEVLSYPVVCHALKSGSVTLLNLPKHHPLTNEEREAFTSYGHQLIPYTYERMIKDGVKFHSWDHYSRQGLKSNDSTIKMSDLSYGMIERIFLSNKDGKELVFVSVRKINVDRGNSIVTHTAGAKASHIKVCSAIVFGDLRIVNHSEVMRKVVLIDTGRDGTYVADIPNFFEKD